MAPSPSELSPNLPASTDHVGGRVVSLIGYRGVGKSTIAPRLASALGWTWIDADVELERRAGRSIREIFATDGEPAFRQLERDLLVELLARSQLVLATGGGAVLDPRTRADLRAAGPVVWLQADVGTIIRRLGHDSASNHRRPALTTMSRDEEIRALLAVREPLYVETATIPITVAGRSVKENVREILRQLNGEVPPRP